MDAVFNLGLPGIVAFGGVGLLTYIFKKYWKQDLDPEFKFGLLVVLFFVALYIPADLGTDIFNKIKLAVAGALGIHALWTVRKA